MSRIIVTTCDAPGCDAEIRGDLTPAWYRLHAGVEHGPFPTIVDRSNEVLDGNRAFFACCIEHVSAVFMAKLAVAYEEHQKNWGRSA